jgi:hypothetical protein
MPRKIFIRQRCCYFTFYKNITLTTAKYFTKIYYYISVPRPKVCGGSAATTLQLRASAMLLTVAGRMSGVGVSSNGEFSYKVSRNFVNLFQSLNGWRHRHTDKDRHTRKAWYSDEPSFLLPLFILFWKQDGQKRTGRLMYIQTHRYNKDLEKEGLTI